MVIEEIYVLIKSNYAITSIVFYHHMFNFNNLLIISKFTIPTIGDKIVEILYLNRVISENKRIRTPPVSPPFKVGVFVVFYR